MEVLKIKYNSEKKGYIGLTEFDRKTLAMITGRSYFYSVDLANMQNRVGIIGYTLIIDKGVRKCIILN